MNKCQSEAAYADVSTPLLIIAGAGSGKTMTMVRRVEHIMKSTQCKPSEILAITFTRNAAKEMKERLMKICGSASSGVLVSTIHAICLRILRSNLVNAPHLGFSPKFSFVSKREQMMMMDEAIDEFDKMKGVEKQDPKTKQFRVKQIFASAMKFRASPSSLHRTPELQFVLDYYSKLLKETDALDFSGLIQLTIQLLSEVCGDAIRQQYRFILVDEFQDVSLSQFNLVKALLGNRGCITAVGDDDQSIYGFQGANIGNFTQFEQHFRGLKKVRLEQNYRSSGNIVTASNAVIAVNVQRQQKRLWTEKGGGDRIAVCECRNAQCEAAFVVAELRRRRSLSGTWRSMAVLFRTNSTGVEFQQSLRTAQIPFTVQGEHLYSPMEIDDVLSLLRITVRDDNRALLAIAKFTKTPIQQPIFEMMREHATSNNVSWLHAARCIITQPLAKLKKKLKTDITKDNRKRNSSPITPLKKLVDMVDTLRLRVEELPLASFMRRVVDLHPWVKQRMQRESSSSSSEGGHYGSLGKALIHEADVFVTANPRPAVSAGLGASEDTKIAQRIDKVSQFLDHLSLCTENGDPLKLQSEIDKEEELGRDAVFLGTVHQSKGLEWDTVFVVRFNENQFPLASFQTEETADAVAKEKVFEEEERRLAYVALSRGRLNLVITFILQDEAANSISVHPSRFLSDVPREIQTRVECFSPTDPPSLNPINCGPAQPLITGLPGPTSSWSAFLQNPNKPKMPDKTSTTEPRDNHRDSARALEGTKRAAGCLSDQPSMKKKLSNCDKHVPSQQNETPFSDFPDDFFTDD